MTAEATRKTACDVTLRIGGEAGQGVNVVSGLLGKALLRQGLHVFTHHDVMSRIRGGHNFSQIRASDVPVMAPAERVDILVCLDENTLRLYEEELDGVIIHDPDWGGPRKGGKSKRLPLSLEKIAKEKGGDARMANTVAAAASLAVLGLSLDPLLDLLGETFGSKGDKVLEGNRACARAGFAAAKDAFEGPRLCAGFEAPPGGKRILITGSEAMAIGALASGLRFYTGYPMSPATAIMEFLASKKDEYGLVIEQAEDEISAVNMAVGASFAGARTLVATSGGGLALMVEGISLAGMTETPLVIIDCQRPAPATGLPTRTEQADLLFVAHCGHGEFPRAVLAPSTAEEAFYLTNRAFYLADKYQTPVFVLGDQFLNDSSWTGEPFGLDGLLTGGSVRPTAEDLKKLEPYAYKRYALTESGISPFILPGTPRQVVYADSDEHTEEGHITESAEVRRAMVGKRLRKASGLAQEMAPPRVHPATAAVYTVSWGSTFGAVREAVRLLRDKGLDIGYIHWSEVFPLRTEAVIQAVERGAELVAIENNATGQFARLLRMETGLAVDRRILRFDGRPFTARELTREIEKKRGS